MSIAESSARCLVFLVAALVLTAASRTSVALAGLTVGPDGSVMYMPDTATDVLGKILLYHDAVDARSVTAAPDPPGLRLESTGRGIVLLLPQMFGDVRVEVELEIEDLRGGVGVVLHENPSRRWAVFCVEEDGVAELVSYRKKARRVLDRVSYDRTSGPFTIEISARGRELRGAVDGTVIATGERQPPIEGRVGLFLDGHGAVRILSLRAVPLD